MPTNTPIAPQDWHAYSADQHRTWDRLVQRRLASLRQTGAAEVLDGIATLGLDAPGLPELSRLNARLRARTGWEVVGVDGYLEARTFLGLLARRRFPSTTWIRPATALDYIPSPDIFHDVFGHVPLHAHPAFADLLQRFGQLGEAAADDRALTAVQRLFWFTIEFGLIEGPAGPRLYGSGLVSSIAEEAQALGPGATRRPFVLEAVLDTPFDVDAVQPVYYVLRDFRQLRDAVEQVATGCGRAPA